MNKLLVVGSKGFIGSHAVKYLKNIGYQVWGSDVVVDYTDNNYFLIDATTSDFHAIFQAQQVHVCINCSGAASVPDSLQNPLRDHHLNTINVFKLLDAIRMYQPSCKFINLSSAAIYGNPVSLPVKETASLKPLSPYGWHKLYAEQICQEFHHFYGLRTCSLRIFSAYGNGLKKQLFWDLYQKALGGAPFTLFGTGRESRDFIHVADLVRVLDLVIQQNSFGGGAINVANGREVTIQEVVSLFYSFWPEHVSYTFSGEERKGDPNNWMADISTLQSMGYIPQVSLEIGLKNYYEWARSQQEV